MTKFRVTQGLTVEAEDFAAAGLLAEQLWEQDDHNTLARHNSRLEIEKIEEPVAP